MTNTVPHFTDNPAILNRLDRYKTVTIDIGKVLESWRRSLYAFEYLTQDGHIKAVADMPDTERRKLSEIRERLKAEAPLERPVMGIGLLENVEIGSGRPVFLFLASSGYKTLSVHIPKSNEDEFQPFLSTGS